MITIIRFMRFFILIWILLISANVFAVSPKRVLVFGGTIRAAHADILPLAGNALVETLTESNLLATLILDPHRLDQTSLSNFDVVVLLDVSEKVLSDQSKRSMEHFVERGGGLVAIHASIGAGRDWPWLQDLFGVQFVDHPPIQEGQVSILKSDLVLGALKVRAWSQFDEWYNFSSAVEPKSAIAMTVETKDKKVRSIAWSRSVGRGRFFYIAAGHSASLYSDTQSAFMKTLVIAINWAANLTTNSL
jgi:type 1 glutamine amidotransferase